MLRSAFPFLYTERLTLSDSILCDARRAAAPTIEKATEILYLLSYSSRDTLQNMLYNTMLHQGGSTVSNASSSYKACVLRNI